MSLKENGEKLLITFDRQLYDVASYIPGSFTVEFLTRTYAPDGAIQTALRTAAEIEPFEGTIPEIDYTSAVYDGMQYTDGKLMLAFQEVNSDG